MPFTRRQFIVSAGGATLAALAGPQLVSTRAQAIPGAISFRGAAGKSILGPITLAAGITVLRAQHNGTGNFAVSLFLPGADVTPQQAVDRANYLDIAYPYDQISGFKGGAVTLTPMPGEHYLSVSSSGAFQISVEQPLPGTVEATEQTSFSGKGIDCSSYFLLPTGISSVSAQSTSPFLRVWIYHLDDLGGGALLGGVQGYDGRFFDLSDPSNPSSYPIALPDTGPYILAVTTGVTETDSWTVVFS